FNRAPTLPERDRLSTYQHRAARCKHLCNHGAPRSIWLPVLFSEFLQHRNPIKVPTALPRHRYAINARGRSRFPPRPEVLKDEITISAEQSLTARGSR